MPGESFASGSQTQSLFTGPKGSAESKAFDAEMEHLDWTNAKTDAEKTSAAGELGKVSTSGLNDSLASEVSTDQSDAQTNPEPHVVDAKMDSEGVWGAAKRQLMASAKLRDPNGDPNWTPMDQQVWAYMGAIQKSNAEVLSNPNVIQVGQRLKLPSVDVNLLPPITPPASAATSPTGNGGRPAGGRLAAN